MSTYYVDGTQPDDTGAGTSAATAKKTIAAGVALLAAGDTLYIKASATYTLTTTVTLSTSGSVAAGLITVEGYTTTPGARDGRPVITTATNSTALFSLNNGAGLYRFVHLKGTNTAATRAGMFAGIGSSGQSYITIEDCVCDGCSYLYDGNIRGVAGLNVIGTESTNNTAGVILNQGGATDVLDRVFFHNFTGIGYSAGNANQTLICRNSIIVTGTKGISDGSAGSARTLTVEVSDSIIAGHTSHGISQENVSTTWNLGLRNNIIYGNGGYGVNLLDPTLENDARCMGNARNAYGANTSGNRNNLSAGYGDVALSGSPFTNSAANDYSLNATAGAGAACRGVVQAFGTSTNSYRDIGAAQHQDAGGGGGGGLIGGGNLSGGLQ